ncbi:MAG: AAA family ATPase [Myxococcota bacterium]|nr:AAA family ATPase [Myxococcota bacterium]
MHTDLAELRLLCNSRVPILAIETAEETRVIDLCCTIAAERDRPIFRWSVADGFARIDVTMGRQAFAKKPHDALAQIRSTSQPGFYLLLDFHPYLSEPLITRMLKEIALNHQERPHTVVLVGPRLDIPIEIMSFCGEFRLALPDPIALESMIRDEARAWSEAHSGRRVRANRESLKLLIRYLQGLTANDARKLAHQAIFNDGAITESDFKLVIEAKHRLLDRGGVLAFDFDAAHLKEIGGLDALKKWLSIRRQVFLDGDDGLDRPKGIVLLGVQGCGKSLAAKAVAGTWGVPLLHLDVGSLYNKFFGETERNLRDALETAQVMAPCVLWIDEIEKALSSGQNDGGTSQRVLGTLLTWMAENDKPVFIVATANRIEGLPPELLRKGRVDEIFFVDLPTEEIRALIFELHLTKRGLRADTFDIAALARAADEFSGAEIEQAIVSALYLARSESLELATDHVLREIAATRPLAVVMSEKLAALRSWARERTVPAH